MIETGLLFVLIPALNAVANIVLKISVAKKASRGLRLYLGYQFLSYSLFIVVMGLSFIFLQTHPASHFIMLMCLNFLTTLYLSQIVFHEPILVKLIPYDLLIIIGLAVFYYGTTQHG